MKKINKILICLSIMLVLSFVCMSDVFASAIKINGGVTDIYSSGGEGSATYDADTKTLTLNNYNNEYILLEGFDGETLNVVLKGNNIIKSPTGYVDDTFDIALGYVEGDLDNEVTLNITGEEGSKLTIDGYYIGIYIYGGSLNISNVDLEFTDVDYTAIYSRNSELMYIKDSKIKIIGSKYGISNELYDIKLENVDYISEDTSSEDFYAGDSLIIKNSKLDMTNSGLFASSTELEIDDSNVVMKSGFNFFGSNRVTINNSKIDVDVIGLAMSIYMNETDGYYLHVNNSDVTIVSSLGAVLNIQTQETIDFDSIIVYQNVDMLETNYLKTYGEVEIIGNIYGYFITQPTKIYTIAEVESLADLAGKELHLVAKNNKVDNPDTGDSFSIYLLTGTLSLIGLASALIYFKKKSA